MHSFLAIAYLNRIVLNSEHPMLQILRLEFSDDRPRLPQVLSKRLDKTNLDAGIEIEDIQLCCVFRKPLRVWNRSSGVIERFPRLTGKFQIKSWCWHARSTITQICIFQQRPSCGVWCNERDVIHGSYDSVSVVITTDTSLERAAAVSAAQSIADCEEYVLVYNLWNI